MTAATPTVPPNYSADATLRSTSETVVWGHIPAGAPPALHIKSGQTVRIDTVSHGGLVAKQDPVAYFRAAGIPPEQVLPDALEIYRNKTRAEGDGVHILTGPIYVEDAHPGDRLEVRILDIEFRVPYGVNSTGPGSGVLPDLLAMPTAKIVRLDLRRRVALFSSDIEVPLAPFMGIMAVAPPPDLARVNTTPPGRWGGNLDLKQLQTGATLYLPVINEGALFYVGDGHGVQGDGEVNGTALEISLTPTLQFIVHRGIGKNMKWPHAEDKAHDYLLGMDPDLGEAIKYAVAETVDFLQRERGLSEAEAYALASIGVDFRIGEAVNSTKMVYGMIPKKLFRQNSEYWNKK